MTSLLHSLRTSIGQSNMGEMLAPASHRLGPWAETVFLTSFACALGWWAAPDDPLLLHSSFPWLWLVPVLIALRYGLLPGIVSALGLLGDWTLFAQQVEPMPDLPRAYFVGGGLLTLLCGEFNALWNSRSEQRNEANAYLDERLNRLTRRYRLLRLSHDRIEQAQLVRPGSLRDALLRLRELNPGTTVKTPLPGIADLLQLMAQYCQLEAAAIYLPPTTKGKHYRVDSPVATFGEPPPLQGDDPMLRNVMERRALMHIAEQGEAEHLVIAPILGSNGQLLGILSVSNMPFFALNQENLQLLDLLLGYYADIVQVGGEAQELRRQLPGCPWAFVEELVRVQHIQRLSGMTSHVVVFRFSGDRAYEIAGGMQRMHRTLDVTWSADKETKPALAVLLPLSSDAASEEYVLRIKHWLRDRYGIGGEMPGVDIVNLGVERPDFIERLQTALLAEEVSA